MPITKKDLWDALKKIEKIYWTEAWTDSKRAAKMNTVAADLLRAGLDSKGEEL